MLPLPDLRGQEPMEIVKTALNFIKQNEGDWKGRGIHDPGVTFLELLAVLESKQQMEIDKIGLRNLLKFLKMLQITPKRGSCAKTYIEVVPTVNCVLPPVTKFYADDIVFETVNERKIYQNEISVVGNATGDVVKMAAYNANNTAHNILIFEQRPYDAEKFFYVGFKNPLPREAVTLTVHVVQNRILRNPVSLKDDFYPLSQIQWEYYGKKGGVVGWHELRRVIDDTRGFLFSGDVKFFVPSKMHSSEIEGHTAFYVRAACQRYAYEEPPRLLGIALNSLLLEQKDTKCCTIAFTKKAFEANQMYFRNGIANQDYTDVYIKNGEAFATAEDLEVDFLIKNEDGVFRFATSKREMLAEVFSPFSESDVVFYVVVYEKDFYEIKILGSTDGTAGQEFIFDGPSGICYDSFEIMIKGKTGWNIWQKMESLDACEAKDRAYILEPVNGAIAFGNNRNGKAPAAGNQNIRIIQCAVSNMEKGAVQSGTIQRMANQPEGISLIHNQSVNQEKAPQGIKELFETAADMMAKTERAVCIEDYRDITFCTPGLRIIQVTVLPSYCPNLNGIEEENAVTIVAEPYGRRYYPALAQGYTKNIKRYLEKYKLITTKLYVTLPVPVPIDVYGEIIANRNYTDAHQRILNTIDEYMDELQEKHLGITLSYGDIFNKIENLDCCIRIKHLQLDLTSDTATKNTFGDIRVPPHARIYMRKHEIVLS